MFQQLHVIIAGLLTERGLGFTFKTVPPRWVHFHWAHHGWPSVAQNGPAVGPKNVGVGGDIMEEPVRFLSACCCVLDLLCVTYVYLCLH